MHEFHIPPQMSFPLNVFPPPSVGLGSLWDFLNIVNYFVQNAYIAVAYNGNIFPADNYQFKLSN